MNYQELRNALASAGGKLTIARDTLGPSVAGLLDAHYDGQPLVITDVEPGAGDGEGETVVLNGRASFLGVADAPVTARFSLNGDGLVRALIQYKLREATPGPNAWTFSRSFPTLPSMWNYALGPMDNAYGDEPFTQQKPYVESLDLLDTSFAVATHAQNDPELGVALEPGVNFLSRMRPQGMMGVLEYAINGASPLTLAGPIRIPKPTDATLGLTRWQRAWDRPDAPGIHLASPLDLNFKIGKLTFDSAALRIYTPISTDWQRDNSTFQPAYGYTGRLSIPSAGITVDLSADLEWGLPRALLDARCEGVSLGKLTQLVDITGTDSLASSLPDALQSAVNKLEKLELTDLQIALRLEGATPSIDAISVTLGMPGLVWDVLDDHLQVEDIACRFRVTNPFGGGPSSVGVTVTGTLDIEGVPVSITAEKSGGFRLFARIDGQSIPLAALMKTHAPGVPAPSDLTVSYLALSVNPGVSYSMSTSLTSKPKPWTIPVGRSKITIGDVSFDLTYPKGGPVSGVFAGRASFGKDFSLAVRYGIPGNIALRGTFNNIKLRSLLEELSDQAGVMPPGFDLTFSTASVLIQKVNSDYAFQLAAAIPDFGVLALDLRKMGAQWGFAVGMDLGAGKIAKIPGLSALKPIEDLVHLEKLLLVLSSTDNASFQFPDLAQFNAPQLGTKGLSLPKQTSGVSKGLMLFAEWQLDQKDQKHALLMKLLGLGSTQLVTVAVGANPATDAKLFFSQRTKIQGHKFDYQLGVMLTGGQGSMFLAGDLTMNIQGQPQTFATTMAFVPTGAFMSATMKGSAPIDCKVFKLSNLAVEIGVNWSGIPSLGLAATIDTTRFSSSIAIFFDSTNPAQSLVAGSLSDMTLKDVVDTLLGGAAPSSVDDALAKVQIKGTNTFKIAGDLADKLDNRDIASIASALASAGKVQIPGAADQVLLCVNKRGSAWHLTDLSKMRHYALVKRGSDIEVSVETQFYFAPQATFIGAIKFPQGYYLNGQIDIFGFKASATVEMVGKAGISIDAQMDKIVLGGEQVFSLTAAEGSGGPTLSIATMSRPDNPTPELRAPHIYINGRVKLLGIQASAFASVSTKGIALEIKGPLAPGVTFDLDAEFGGQELTVNGDLKMGIGTIDLGELGKVKVNTDLDGGLGVRVSGQSVEIAVEGTFEFLGADVDIGRTKVDVTPDALTNIGKTLEKQVEKALRAVFNDVNRWTSAVGDGIVDGVGDTEKVLQSVYKKSEKDAKELAKGINKGANAAAKEINQGANTVAKETKKLGKKLKKLF